MGLPHLRDASRIAWDGESLLTDMHVYTGHYLLAAVFVGGATNARATGPFV